MTKGKKQQGGEILRDYRMLEKMSKDLALHQKNIRLIGKRVARRMKTYEKYGLIENLTSVAISMDKAKRQIDKARRELKLI